MYIKHNDINYQCDCYISPLTIKYAGLPEDFPAPISGDIVLCANDGFEMRTDTAEGYLRQTFENGVLTLTNIPETEESESDEPIVAEPTTAEILNALLGVTNNE